MLKIIYDSNTILISDEIYSIKGMSILELSYIIENNSDNTITKIRSYIRKKKLLELEKISKI